MISEKQSHKLMPTELEICRMKSWQKIYVYCWIAESVQHSNLVMLEVCAMQTYLNGFNQKRNSFEQLSGCEVEVIGNIFDDKELEKGE